MSSCSYQVNSEYVGGLDGVGRVQAQGFELAFSAPKELHGAGQGTNPEELLTAAASACYLITLATILKFQGIEVRRISNKTEMDLKSTLPMRITQIRHRPVIVVASGCSAETRAKIEALIQRSEQACLVGQSLKPSVFITVAASIEEEA